MNGITQESLSEALIEIRRVEAMLSESDRTGDLTPLLRDAIEGGERDLDVLYGRYFAMIDAYRLSWQP